MYYGTRSGREKKRGRETGGVGGGRKLEEREENSLAAQRDASRDLFFARTRKRFFKRLIYIYRYKYKYEYTYINK